MTGTANWLAPALEVRQAAAIDTVDERDDADFRQVFASSWPVEEQAAKLGIGTLGPVFCSSTEDW